jgi:hypothetical protein
VKRMPTINMKKKIAHTPAFYVWSKYNLKEVVRPWGVISRIEGTESLPFKYLAILVKELCIDFIVDCLREPKHSMHEPSL